MSSIVNMGDELRMECNKEGRLPARIGRKVEFVQEFTKTGISSSQGIQFFQTHLCE